MPTFDRQAAIAAGYSPQEVDSYLSAAPPAQDAGQPPPQDQQAAPPPQPQQAPQQDMSQVPTQPMPQVGGANVVDPRALAYNLAFENGKGIGQMYNENTKPIVAANGMVYLRTPDGGVQIAPGSLAALATTKATEAAIQGNFEGSQQPLGNSGQSIYTTKTEMARNAQQHPLNERIANAVGATQPGQGGAPGAPSPSQFDPGKSYGTPPQLLDNLMQTESGGNPYAINPQTKAMGPYQFMPETIAMLGKQGVKFNPFDPQQARAAADYYIQTLASKTGGDLHKAMAAYGGFKTADPTAYVGKVMAGVQPAAAAPALPAQPQPNTVATVDAPQLGVTQSDAARAAQSAASAQNTKVGGDWADAFTKQQDAALQAPQKIRNIETLDMLLSQMKPGVQARSVLGLQKVASALGFQIPDSANAAGAAAAYGKWQAMQLRDTSQGGGISSRVSNMEFQTLQNMGMGIDNLPGVNHILKETYIQQQQRMIDVAKIMADYRQSHNVQGTPYIDENVMPAIQNYYKGLPDVGAILNGKVAQVHPGWNPATGENKPPGAKNLGTVGSSPQAAPGKIGGSEALGQMWAEAKQKLFGGVAAPTGATAAAMPPQAQPAPAQGGVMEFGDYLNKYKRH